MVTDEPRLPVKVTVRDARADGSVEAARRREAVAEGSFMVRCGCAVQAATQHPMRGEVVKCGSNSGDAAKWSRQGESGGRVDVRAQVILGRWVGCDPRGGGADGGFGGRKTGLPFPEAP